MYRKAVMTCGARAAVLGTLAMATACSHWPWHHPPPAAPLEVHELDVSGASAAGHFAQYWKRNTLLLDLSGASGSGSIVLKPATDAGWPVRLALRVMPGAVGALEVRGEERVELPITPGSKPVDLELAPGLYSAHTPQLTVSWGPAAPVPSLPEPTPRR